MRSFPYSKSLRSSRPGASPYGFRVRILIFSWLDFWSPILRAAVLPPLLCSGRASARLFFSPLPPVAGHSPLVTRHSSLATSTLATFLALPHPTSYNRL